MSEVLRFQTVPISAVVEGVKKILEGEPPGLADITIPCRLYNTDPRVCRLEEGTFNPLCGSCGAAKADHGDAASVAGRLIAMLGFREGMVDSVSSYSPSPDRLVTTCDPGELGLQGPGTPNLVVVMEHKEGDVRMFSA